MDYKKEHFVTRENHLIKGVLLAEVFPEVVEVIRRYFNASNRPELIVQLPFIVIPINAILGDENQFSIAVYTKPREPIESSDYLDKFDRQLFAVPYDGGTVYISADELDSIDCFYFENLSQILDVLLGIDFNGRHLKIFDDDYRKIPFDLLKLSAK